MGKGTGKIELIAEMARILHNTHELISADAEMQKYAIEHDGKTTDINDSYDMDYLRGMEHTLRALGLTMDDIEKVNEEFIKNQNHDPAA